jgi:hypothetical protein
MNPTPHNWFMDYVVMPLMVAAQVFFGWLPTVALIVPVVWYCIQIYESRTFKAWLEKARLWFKSTPKG